MLLDVDSGAHRGRGAVGRAKRPLKQRGVVRPVGILLVLLWFHLVTAHNDLFPRPQWGRRPGRLLAWCRVMEPSFLGSCASCGPPRGEMQALDVRPLGGLAAAVVARRRDGAGVSGEGLRPGQIHTGVEQVADERAAQVVG